MEAQKQDNTPKIIEQKEFSDTPPVFLYNIVGNIKTSSLAPTVIPNKIQDQLVIYKSGSTWKLYIADLANSTWKSVTLS
jgi:hypothetical protein